MSFLTSKLNTRKRTITIYISFCFLLLLSTLLFFLRLRAPQVGMSRGGTYRYTSNNIDHLCHHLSNVESHASTSPPPLPSVAPDPRCPKSRAEMLVYITRILDSAGIGYFLCFGTLLGFVRDHRVIPWTRDVDICVPFFTEPTVRSLLEHVPCFGPPHKNYGFAWTYHSLAAVELMETVPVEATTTTTTANDRRYASSSQFSNKDGRGENRTESPPGNERNAGDNDNNVIKKTIVPTLDMYGVFFSFDAQTAYLPDVPPQRSFRLEHLFPLKRTKPGEFLDSPTAVFTIPNKAEKMLDYMFGSDSSWRIPDKAHALGGNDRENDDSFARTW